jgi:hypothetical protein
MKYHSKLNEIIKMPTYLEMITEAMVALSSGWKKLFSRQAILKRVNILCNFRYNKNLSDSQISRYVSSNIRAMVEKGLLTQERQSFKLSPSYKKELKKKKSKPKKKAKGIVSNLYHNIQNGELYFASYEEGVVLIASDVQLPPFARSTVFYIYKESNKKYVCPVKRKELEKWEPTAGPFTKTKAQEYIKGKKNTLFLLEVKIL